MQNKMTQKHVKLIIMRIVLMSAELGVPIKETDVTGRVSPENYLITWNWNVNFCQKVALFVMIFSSKKTSNNTKYQTALNVMLHAPNAVGLANT